MHQPYMALFMKSAVADKESSVCNLMQIVLAHCPFTLLFSLAISYQADCSVMPRLATILSNSAHASGVSSSLGGTICQNRGRYTSHSLKIAAPLLLPVFSLQKVSKELIYSTNSQHMVLIPQDVFPYHVSFYQALQLHLSCWGIYPLNLHYLLIDLVHKMQTRSV